MSIDENPGRPAKLRPRRDEVPLLVKNLDAFIAHISDEKPPFRIHSEGMRTHHISGARSFVSERLDELSIFREFHNPGSATRRTMPVRDKNIPIGSDNDRV